MSDLIHLLNQAKVLILACGIFCALLTFSYLLLKPVHFTAKGIFKNGASQSPHALLNTLQLFSNDDSYLPKEDPRTFLRSYSVIEQVVLQLDLQASVAGNPSPGRFQEIWTTLKTAITLRNLKKSRLHSQILRPHIAVPDRLIVPDYPIGMQCTCVHFPCETAKKMTIHWVDEQIFQVYEKKKLIGTGEIHVPFFWENGSFILAGKPKKNKIYGLHFIPLEQAILSIQNSIIIAKDMENPSLLHISYTHRDRHLAARMVNAVMEQFQEYLKTEGKKKITKQLEYLQQRHDENTEHFENVLEKHKQYLETHLDSGAIISLEKELEFMTHKQSHIKERLLNVQLEIEYLSQSPLPFTELIAELKSHRHLHPLQAFSIDNVKLLIQQKQHELDQLYLNRVRYDTCLTKLNESKFEGASLSKMLNDEFTKPRFEKIEHLHHRLVDHQSWSAKEREHFISEMETEKLFLKQYLIHLKEGTTLQENALKERILILENNLTYLLIDAYDQERHSLETLANQAAHFPQKWLNQQKIELNTKLYSEMMVSITKMIEAKNIGYNLDYLMASLFKKALSPTLPNNPKLFQGTIVTAVGGLLLGCMMTCFYLIWLGPSASRANLTSYGRKYISDKELIPMFGLELISASGPITLVASQQPVTWVTDLINWFTQLGEKVFILDFTSNSLPELMGHEEKRDPYLASKRFQHHLSHCQEHYDRVWILSKAPVGSYEMKLLMSYAHTIIYGITTERLAAVQTLPDHTLFFESEQAPAEPLSLNTIKPKLDNLLKQMMSSSYALSQSALSRFPLKKT